MKGNNKFLKAEFWDSDVFYQKELQKAWALSHDPDIKDQQGGHKIEKTVVLR